MAQARAELDALLRLLVPNVYFQPPENVRMAYPAIVYERDELLPTFADNVPYSVDKRYQITVITNDPDSTVPDQLARFPQCRFSRHFVADNLYHDVFNLYF